MAADLLASWVPSGGAAFNFTGSYGIVAVEDGGVERRIPSIDTGADGELATSGLASPRTVTISGTVDADDLDTLRARIDALGAAFASRLEGQLFANSDRFLVCRVQRFSTDPDDGMLLRKWSAVFRASQYPFWQAGGAEWTAAAAGGNIAHPAQGATAYPIRLEVNVSATGAPLGTISLAHDYGTATIKPSATGLYIIDGSKGTVTRGGADAIDDFLGDFPRLDPTAGNIVVTTSAGATYSAANAYARALYETL